MEFGFLVIPYGSGLLVMAMSETIHIQPKLKSFKIKPGRQILVQGKAIVDKLWK